MGNATIQGELWGARAEDWAEIQESVFYQAYEAVLDSINVRPGIKILDVGCGSGLFCSMAAERGANVTGIDAAEALIAIANQRLSQGDFRVGEMETLPYADNSFDVVTGLNSFQYAENPVNALNEARRVAKNESSVVVMVWGKAEDCDAADHLMALGPLLPPPPPGAAGPFALSEEAALKAFVSQANLTPLRIEDADDLWAYPDFDTAMRGMLSSGPVIKAIQHSGENSVWESVSESIASFKTPAGGYELKNKFRFLTATV
ncbi:class I SAM-dependent methyltransferase [Desulfonema magnum]|uniref:Electron transfer flavoprotein, subunit beta n=1 Tax=Desulfonema magnum TaxID=45655 RepID=A0A975GKH2_9BACT|nr:class I SAM-dependent methyltransferase [Desulfonema magnum]QTA84701.1 Putative electron transfer flavoprotein, subunit beta [Desulfonema magnum]